MGDDAGRWEMAWEAIDTGGGSLEGAPELADIGRLGRRLVRGLVEQARADEGLRFPALVAEHLGMPTAGLPIATEQWAPFEHVNVQAGLDAWLAEPGREHRVLGIRGHGHHGEYGLSDLVVPEAHRGHQPRPGNVSRVTLPAGPDGQTLECLRAAMVLVREGELRLVLLVRGPDRDYETSLGVEVMANEPAAASRVGLRLRELTLEHNVYRGQVVSFGRDMFGSRDGALRFHHRQPLPAESVILPSAAFADIRRQVVGVARNRDRLREAGQHLKRGLLLYGPPGAGKTHTVRHLIGELTDTTVVELTGESLGAIKEACSIARVLQPAMVVVEDVDLIAQQRDRYGGSGPLLFSLLNEMDGLAEDADVVFLLTTNRPDLLEPALAARPGRVDQAVHIDVPDRESRRRLLELYRGRLDLDTTRLDDVLERTEGVTASFLKELLRRAAVLAADRDGATAPEGPLQVSADELDHALDDLLDTRNAMTRAALGYAADGARVPWAEDRAEPGLYDDEDDDIVVLGIDDGSF